MRAAFAFALSILCAAPATAAECNRPVEVTAVPVRELKALDYTGSPAQGAAPGLLAADLERYAASR